MRPKILTAVTTKNIVLWDMPPRRLVEMYWHSRRILWFHLSDRRSYPRKWWFSKGKNIFKPIGKADIKIN